MAKTLLELSQAEIRHILALLREAELEGSYYGNKAQYYARTKRLIELFDALCIST